jgi:WD40 repeat protein
LANKCNALCWNPTEPINLIVGCDDSNCYTFDLRKMDTMKLIHKDHVGAIMDLDIAPTGKEFVTGSYDKTLRIFDINGAKSKEVYHGNFFNLFDFNFIFFLNKNQEKECNRYLVFYFQWIVNLYLVQVMI